MVKSNVYSIIIFILIFSSFLNNELSYLVQICIFFVLLFSNGGTFSFNLPTKRILRLMIMLLTILFISTFANFWFRTYSVKSEYLIFKDLYNFTYPFVIILNASLLSKLIEMEKFIKVIIIGGILSVVIHFSFLIQQNDIFAIANDTFDKSLLNVNGFTELLCYFFLIKSKIRFKARRILLLIILTSLLLYFSRTLLVLLFLIYLYDLRKKDIIKNAVFFSVILSIVVIGLSGTKFIDKIIRTPSEIFNSSFNDKQTIKSNWRAYEAFVAVDGVLTSPFYIPKFLGFGLGSLIDLGFYQKLNDKEFRYLNKIHNGLAELFFKSGFLGLVAFLFINFKLIFSIPQGNKRFTRYFAISLFITGFVIGGILNKGELSNYLFVYTYLNATNSNINLI